MTTMKRKDEAVRVVVRCRPMSSKEIAENHESITAIHNNRGVIEIKNPNKSSTEPPKSFTFDAVYGESSKQMDLYDETFRDLVDSVLAGFNGTIFAYGQTGTGKTFTMQGLKDDPELRGVIPNSFEHIFSHISRSKEQQYLVRASYLEIYQEEIRDLLAKDQSKRFELKERPDTGVYIKDLSSFVTKSIKEIEQVMHVGNQNRSVGATNMNEHSSRSHAIFVVTVECGETSADDGENHIRVGKLNMVDLAGSERQSKTGATGDRFKEATKINLSLSALGNVISALVDGKTSHIPYRDSKLTRLLQDSLGGNAKTIMVATISPASYNFDETITTLRYANRAKNIKNKPRINEDPKDALLRQFQEEIARLKGEMMKKGGKKKKRRKEKGENEGDGGDSEEEDEGEEDKFAAQQKARLEEEKNKIKNDESIIAEERKKMLEKIEEKEKEMKKADEQKKKLESKLKAMESKLLSGGKNILDHTNEQHRELEQRRKLISEQNKKERLLQQDLEEKEEVCLLFYCFYVTHFSINVAA